MELGGGEEAGGERGLRDVGELPAGGYDLGLVGAREGDVREILIPPKVSESGEKKCIKKKFKKNKP